MDYEGEIAGVPDARPILPAKKDLPVVPHQRKRAGPVHPITDDRVTMGGELRLPALSLGSIDLESGDGFLDDVFPFFAKPGGHLVGLIEVHHLGKEFLEFVAGHFVGFHGAGDDSKKSCEKVGEIRLQVILEAREHAA